MPRTASRSQLRLDAPTFDALVARAAVEDDGRYIRLESHRIAFTPEQQRARDGLIARLDEARFTPPLAGERWL